MQSQQFKSRQQFSCGTVKTVLGVQTADGNEVSNTALDLLVSGVQSLVGITILPECSKLTGPDSTTDYSRALQRASLTDAGSTVSLQVTLVVYKVGVEQQLQGILSHGLMTFHVVKAIFDGKRRAPQASNRSRGKSFLSTLLGSDGLLGDVLGGMPGGGDLGDLLGNSFGGGMPTVMDLVGDPTAIFGLSGLAGHRH